MITMWGMNTPKEEIKSMEELEKRLKEEIDHDCSRCCRYGRVYVENGKIEIIIADDGYYR